MKENDGQAARRKLVKKLAVVLIVFLVLIGFLAMIDQRYEEIRGGSQQGGARQSLFNKLRNRHHENYQRNIETRPEYALILSAELTLVDIEIVRRELQRSSSSSQQSYAGVYGIFCKVNFAVHKHDPSAVPMFRDLIQHSPKCEHSKVRAPLYDIATLARDMDNSNQRHFSSLQVPKPLNLTGVVFHESRCGSTLVANTLIAAYPEQHRVFSESPPPVTALKGCGDDYEICSIETAARILRDVLYMMGRTNDPDEQRVFFKIQSIGSRHIEVFRRAFPTTPWMFVYREPVQVMMSHLAAGYRRANCLRSLSRPPPAILQLARSHGHASVSDLSPEEFCAAHLATITETALQNIQESNGYGVAVNYESLPNAMYETILPKHMGVTVNSQMINRIVQVSEQYSKGRGERKKKWEEDSERKEEQANKAIRHAAKQFLLESYQALEEWAPTTKEDRR